MATSTAELTSSRPRSSIDLNRKFAVGMAVAMFIMNFAGFGPTFFLRPFFNVPQIPVYLYVHGVVGTTWFALVVVQAALISNHRFARHRQLGWFGLGLAVVVVALGVYTSTHMVPRNAALGPLSDAELRLFGFVTSADLSSFIVFPTFVALAIYFRRNMDAHMRFLLLATLNILGPAFARIASWFGELPNPVIVLLLLPFIVAMLVHDVRSRGRPHAVTVYGLLFIVGVGITMRVAGVGPAVVAYRLAHL